MTDTKQDERWQGLMRGQVMSATTHKFMTVIRLLDQKAQVMIFLNSILIPVCIKALEQDGLRHAATISITTAILSILAAMICIYPKRPYRKSGDRELNLLHFNDIGHMEKQDYIDQFLPAFNDPEKLAKIVVNDLYDTSRYSIQPKYLWLKVTYALFAFGNLSAIIVALSEL